MEASDLNNLGKFFNNLEEIIQTSYFGLDPYNPNNSEDNYQELFRHNIRERLNLRVESEYTYQKNGIDINGEEISLKNKTERYDLLIKRLGIIFELKAVEKFESINLQQLFHYLDMSDYKYGILINFTKSKDLKKSYARCKVFEKKNKFTGTDKYNNKYSHYKYELINDFKTQSYNEVMGDNVIVKEITKNTITSSDDSSEDNEELCKSNVIEIC
jgi:GxxExxY protein